ncbi:D-Ala-D-Ala carboxypeptidase family metallohydrolase [Psychrobacter sp. HD31]|uniref:D-Ala-D-Ala carboxypeptidase family metallohydrolase n=1 Tax=Psychrobacter sp. HD31 TaxID=3112003 RepID=UPI003DA4A574
MKNQQRNLKLNISSKNHKVIKMAIAPALCCLAVINVACSSNAQTSHVTKKSVSVVPNISYPYGTGKSNLTVTEKRTTNNHSFSTTNHHHHHDSYADFHTGHSHDYSLDDSGLPDFDRWLKQHSYYQYQVDAYRQYLISQLGSNNVPPMAQLIRTARSWDKCGAEPYQVPPRYLWSNIVPTLRLYSDLKKQGVVPHESVIRSVYRDYDLNRCAGGASSSKHLENAAIDIWVPSYEYSQWQQDSLKENLCHFWQYQGESYDFGLGIYSTGAIHLDTQKYRKWGGQFTPSYSACRY